MILRIDLETYSDIDIMKSGVYKYVESPNFEILMIGYKLIDPVIGEIDKGLIDLKDISSLRKGMYLNWLIDQILDPTIIKTAFNANFEIAALSKHFDIKLDPREWRCTKVQALQMGLPGNLAGVAKALGLEQQKDTKGKALINYFSKPCKPTKTNGYRIRNLPEHAPEKWADFCEYCRQDVEVEDAIADKLAKYPIKDSEQELWVLDQKIISGGVLIDTQLVQNAIKCSDEYNAKLMSRAQEISGLDNPNSVAQLKAYLEEAEGEEVESLSKATVKDMLGTDVSDATRELLEIRQELGKTSVKKYQAMDRAECADHRVRGLLEFCGANRTARWAGRLVQLQNLPQNKLPDLDQARALLRDGQFDMIEMLYGNVPDTLSQLIRTAFIAEPGSRFIVADFSAIEARVIAWLAGEKWRMDVFATHGKIYEASASQMFRVPLDQIHKGSPLRQKGKVAELACGYQGGIGALKSMDPKWAATQTDEELQELIDQWRKASPSVVKLWKDVENAALSAVKNKRPVTIQYGVTFSFVDGCLFVKLPSGRRLCYFKAALEPDNYGRDKLTYYGTDDKKAFSKLRTYGGKLVENCIQAIARDCLAESMLRLDKAGYDIRFHVHDEVIIEAPYASKYNMEEVTDIMSQPIPWAPGLLLTADAYETIYYRKD